MDLALLPTLAFFIVFWIIGAFVLNMRDNGVFDFKQRYQHPGRVEVLNQVC